MSQKFGFPYLGLNITALVYFFGLILAVLVPLATGLSLGSTVLSLLRFLGIFLTGWALLNFAVSKELTPTQRLTSIFFALLTLAVLFSVGLSFGFSVHNHSPPWP